MKQKPIERILIGLFASSTAIFAYRDSVSPINPNQELKSEPLVKVRANDTVVAPPIVKAIQDTSLINPTRLDPLLISKAQYEAIQQKIQARGEHVQSIIAAPYLKQIDSQQRVIVALQKRVPEPPDPARMKGLQDSLATVRRQLEIARRTPLIIRDQNFTIPVYPAALDGDTTHPLIDLSGIQYNMNLFYKDSAYQKNGFYVKDYYSVIRPEDISRAKLSGGDRYVIKRDIPNFGFRVQALSSYNVRANTVSIGMGTRVDVGERFNFGLNANYNLSIGLPELTLYIKEDIYRIGR